MKKTEAVLLAAHKIDDFILSQYNALEAGVNPWRKLYLMLQENEQTLNKTLPESITSYNFSVNSLNDLNYIPITDGIIPGSNHFPLLQFYKDFPNYDYYWNIEYDVYFNGDWNEFFNCFEKKEADFLSSHIEYFFQRPLWTWWKSLNIISLPTNPLFLLKSFNPIYRISNAALQTLDMVLKAKNSGHHEALIPTILKHLDFSIEDIGGLGDFCDLELKNKYYESLPELDNFYTESTMRFRPVFDKKEMESNPMKNNRLYHPVKG